MKKTIYTIAIMTVVHLAHSQGPAESMIAAQAEAECAKADLRANLVKPFRSPANDASKQKIDGPENRNTGLRDRLYVNEE